MLNYNVNLKAACCLIKLLLLAIVHDDLREFLTLLVKNVLLGKTKVFTFCLVNP